MSTFEENFSDGFATRLREAIGAESVHGFSKRAGVGDSSVRQYLAGTQPSLDKAVLIAQAAGVSLIWLAKGEGEKFPGMNAKSQSEFESLPKSINRIAVITPEIVRSAVASLVRHLDENNLEMDADSTGEFASILCEMAADAGGYDQRLLDRIMRLKKSL